MNKEGLKKETESFAFALKQCPQISIKLSRIKAFSCELSLYVVKTSPNFYEHEQKGFTFYKIYISHGSKLACFASLSTNKTTKGFSFIKTIAIVRKTLKKSVSCFFRVDQRLNAINNHQFLLLDVDS